MSSDVPSRKHLLLVTFPAYGHIIPLLELARKLVQFHDVSFAVSAGCIEQIKQRELVEPNERVQLWPIEDGYDASRILDPTNMHGFAEMLKLVMEGISQTVAALPTKHSDGSRDKSATKLVDAVIIDNFVALSAEACVEKGIQLYHFAPASTGSLMMMLSVEESWPDLPEGEVLAMQGEPKPGDPPPPIPKEFKHLLLMLQRGIPKLDGVIVNSVVEVEGDVVVDAIRAHPKLGKTPIFTVGPLMQVEKEDPKNFALKGQIARWMDGQNARSVTYVSFGSVAWPTGEQIGELVRGLLAMKQPFILSLRQMYHEHLPTEVLEKIATQFTENKTNCLIVDWAPQKFILGHPSTGVFISHCGWNSSLESLAAGIPLVCWPMFADQLVNGQFLAKRGLGVVVEGTGLVRPRLISAQEVEETVRKVGGLDGEKTSFWTAAQEMKATIGQALQPGGSSHTSLMKLAKLSIKQ